MKKIVLLICFLVISAFGLSAQKYMVAYAAPGVEYYAAGEWKPLARRDMLSEKDKVRIGTNLSLTLIDTNTNEVYAYGKTGETEVRQIVSKGRTSVVKRFAQHLLTSVKNGDADKISYEATVVYRDAKSDGAIYAALKDVGARSAYLLDLELVDPVTGEPLGEHRRLGDRFVFRVTNNSQEHLFVNILGVDSSGEMFDCLPVDEALTMLHLLVPAMSTIDFAEFPLEMTFPTGEERFILLATTSPFDLRNVIKLYEENAPVANDKQGVGRFEITVTVN